MSNPLSISIFCCLGKASANIAILSLSPDSSTSETSTLNCNVQRMQQVCEYVIAHYVHPIALNDIATEVGMNRSAFYIWFKRYKGMAFSKFLTQYRLRTACELLKHSHKSVSEMGYLVGFNDILHFIQMFTKEIGISPGKYRNG